MSTEAALLTRILEQGIPEWVRELGLRLVDAGDGEVVLALPVTARLVHAGGVLCGQAVMAAADTSMLLAVASRLGELRPMTTVQLATNFLRAVPGGAGELRVVGRVLRAGNRLVYGEVELLDSDGRLAAHSTSTYTLL